MILDRTVMRLMLRGVMGGRRTVVLAILAMLPIIAAIAARVGEHVEPELLWARLVQRLILPVIVAFVAVVIGAGAVSDQREDGTILYLAATPLHRGTLAACAVMTAWIAALSIIVPSLVVAWAIATGGALGVSSLVWPLVACALGALAYAGAGVLAAMVLRQPVVVAVLYILLWEGTVATWTSSAEYLSLAAYARAIAVQGIERVNAPEIGAAVGAMLLVAVAAATVVVSARRLSRTELP